jgi:hypothetical protein
VRHQAWPEVAPAIREELRATMVAQLRRRLASTLGRAARRNADRVRRLERAIAAALRLP